MNRWLKEMSLNSLTDSATRVPLQPSSATVAEAVRHAARPTHSQPQSGEERWEPSDEPTRVERILASQFRRGMPVPLSAKEQQDLNRMSLEQRCDYVAKVMVWTARAAEKHLRDTEERRS
jgi:hypothetical protein